MLNSTINDSGIIKTYKSNYDDDLEKDQKGFLSETIYCELREAINSTSIFDQDKSYLAQFNLCCAVIDRLETCVRRLNQYGEYPKSEEDLLIFMMFACMAVDAVKKILEGMKVDIKSENFSTPNEENCYFADVYKRSPIYNPEKAVPNDDKFFEYLRSLMFAHPFETSRAKFLRKDEKQYSPWVIASRPLRAFSRCSDSVGVRIYTNQTDEIIDLLVPFALLKEYIKSRYERLKMATKWVYKQIAIVQKKWKEDKVSRDNGAVDTMIEIDRILSARHFDSYPCREAISLLKCAVTIDKNRKPVEIFRNAIIAAIPELSDAVDNLDNGRVDGILHSIFEYPDTMYNSANYHLSKIFAIQTDEIDDNSIIKKRIVSYADAFAGHFAKRWVTINAETMTYCEIRLLVRTACYLERKKQLESKLSE